MLFHHIGLKYSSFHQLTMYLKLSLHSAPSKSQRANIDQWQFYVLCDDSVSHIAECKTAVEKSNNCDGGCVTGRLEKQE